MSEARYLVAIATEAARRCYPIVRTKGRPLEWAASQLTDTLAQLGDSRAAVPRQAIYDAALAALRSEESRP